MSSITFHLFTQLPQELQIIIWKHAIDSATEYDHASGAAKALLNRSGLIPPLPTSYAWRIRFIANVRSSRLGLLGVSRLSRQIYLEYWKKDLVYYLRRAGQGRDFRGARREARKLLTSIAKDVTKEIERLKK